MEDSDASFRKVLRDFCNKNKLQPTYIDEEEEEGFYCEVGPVVEMVYSNYAHFSFLFSLR